MLVKFAADNFDELLEYIRDIPAGEKRVYQKVKEIFALSVDDDSKRPIAQNFFKSVQNKQKYAARNYSCDSPCSEEQRLAEAMWR